jgi:hypothetical protein
MLGPVLVVAGVLFSFSIYGLYRYLHQDEEIREQVERTVERRRRDTSVEDLKQLVPIGMSKESVRKLLGDPDSIKDVEAFLNPVELWHYQCSDGRVVVTFRDERVQSIRQQ